MKKINSFFKKYSDKAFKTYIVTAIAIAICLVIVLIVGICNHNTQQDYVTYDVIAVTDETYILQECDNTEHYIEVDQSEMYSVGDTVLISYSNGEINNIWLYIDC